MKSAAFAERLVRGVGGLTEWAGSIRCGTQHRAVSLHLFAWQGLPLYVSTTDNRRGRLNHLALQLRTVVGGAANPWSPGDSTRPVGKACQAPVWETVARLLGASADMVAAWDQQLRRFVARPPMPWSGFMSSYRSRYGRSSPLTIGGRRLRWQPASTTIRLPIRG